MTRIYIPQALRSDACVTLPDAAARHVRQVLRLGPGAALTLFDGLGGEYTAAIEKADKQGVQLRVGAHHAVEREAYVAVTLAQCVSKGDRMDYSIQKAVELGVQRIVPIISERSVVKLDTRRWQKKQAHWQAIIVSACQQCGRNRLPALAPVVTLSEWLQASSGLRLILEPRASTRLSALAPAAKCSLLIGPEGGFSAEEIEQARQQGCQPVRFGPRVLRTETAGVAVLAALQALWEAAAGD